MINYKKPALWVALAAAVAVVIAVAAVFLAMRREPPAAPANAWLDLRELRENYTVEQAAADGCVVLDGSDLLSGEKYWIDFVNYTKSGKPAMVRIYQSYSDHDGSYYVKELVYDGEKYTLTFYDRTGDTGEEFLSRQEFKYLIRSPYSPKNSDTGTTDYYLLANDASVTAEGYFNALLSSTMKPEYDIYSHCKIIYSNRISDDYYVNSHYGTAFADIDGDWEEEKCCLGLGPTSGVFSFTLSVYEGDELEYHGVFITDFYDLGFAEDADGTLRVRAISQGGTDAHLFDIALRDGAVRLAENGTEIRSLYTGKDS